MEKQFLISMVSALLNGAKKILVKFEEEAKSSDLTIDEYYKKCGGESESFLVEVHDIGDMISELSDDSPGVLKIKEDYEEFLEEVELIISNR